MQLVLVITCLGRRFEINYPSYFEIVWVKQGQIQSFEKSRG